MLDTSAPSPVSARESLEQGSDAQRQRSRLSGSDKRVLILDFDLYSLVGGGQSAYRRLIEQVPENTYYYFIKDEAPIQARPANVRTIPFDRHYYGNAGDMPAEMSHFYNCYLDSWQFAASARAALGATDFDVVEGPDYRFDTLFIRSALEAHSIRCDSVALALHGNITSVFKEEWSGRSADSRLVAELRVREHLQYRVADARYAISEDYAGRWKKRTGIGANIVDPLCMVTDFAPVMPEGPAGPVDIVYVGRRERCKGPDLFVDMVWCLPPADLNRVRMIGPDAFGHSGVGAMATINQMAANRNITLDISERMSRAELDTLYRGRSLVLLPARHETFNLVALEALRLGCPTFIGEGAGIANWLTSTLPELSDLILDLNCSRSASEVLRRAVMDYDAFRHRIVDALQARNLVADTQSLRTMYEPTHRLDLAARRTVGEIRQRFDSFNRPRSFADLPARAQVYRWAERKTPIVVRSRLHQLKALKGRMRIGLQSLRHPYRTARSSAIAFGLGYLELSGRAAQQIREARDIEGTRGRLLTVDERTTKEITAKLGIISGEVSRSLVARAHVFADMARLERKRRTGDLIAATYQLRIIRWLGEDRFRNLESITETLRRHNFRKEADTAEAMFGDPRDATKRCREILDAQYLSQMTKPELPLAIFDDRRGNSQTKVAVISSLYNAATKLLTLLDNIAMQSLARAGQVEIILVDSNSPTSEYEVFKAFAAQHSIPVAFARSAERETIQAAWNRGIKLARSPYLCFYGADEGMHPDCLGVLANTLDCEPTVDWVIADSIVTNVDKKGVFNNDVMVYDRSDYSHLNVYLDTCYLNWVGGMYRRSIHERFGYYDEAFRAAGDTEFKLRIARHIKSMYVPRRLGIFNNYPEERTTQHPRAEIEDLRAWYLHRTPAGMAYLFDGQPVAVAQNLLRRALCYRKAYLRDASTDFDLANAIARYLVQRGDDPAFARAALRSSEAMLESFRTIELLDFKNAPRVRQRNVLHAMIAARQQEVADETRLALGKRPKYGIFNDNRYEQHWWSWSA